MAVTFSVAISYGKDLGVIEYDGESKTANVIFANEEGKKLVEDYLKTTREINVPDKNLMDFKPKTVNPLADEESLKLSLTRLWNNTKVHVDWSRPVDYVKAHPSY